MYFLTEINSNDMVFLAIWGFINISSVLYKKLMLSAFLEFVFKTILK